MNPLSKSNAPRRSATGGFALILVLVVMSLIVLLSIGLLQLSAHSQRTANQGRLLVQSRANAKLSLALAMAQLQVSLGPDKRASATASIRDTNPATGKVDGVAHPYWAGVWTAADSPFAFSPPRLDRPNYTKTSRFQTWLVSGDPALLATNTASPRHRDLAVSGAVGAGVEMLPLVSAGTDPAAQRDVKVPLLKAANASAGFAWWTSDDGVKATVRAADPVDTNSVAAVLLGNRRVDGDGHIVLDTRYPKRATGLDGRTINLATVELAGATGKSTGLARDAIHDITTRSEVIPVDVTTGRLKRDMNLRLDWLQAQTPATRKAEGTVGWPYTSEPTDPNYDYRMFSWDQLRNYLSIARTGSPLAIDPTTKRPSVTTYKQYGYTGSNGEEEWNANIGGDRFRLQPVLLKMSYTVSYATERLASPADPNKPYALRLYLYPMAVLWNPYNVDIVVPEYCVTGFCPLVFTVKDLALPSGDLKIDLTRNQSATMLAFGPEMGGIKKWSNLVIPAGATKVLYPQPVRWQTNPLEHRHNRFIWHYYMWAQAEDFDLGDANFGGVLKNLRGNQSVANFISQPANEVMGGASDPLRIAVTPSADGPSYAFGTAAAHTDWWGNNGSGSDNAETLQKFGVSTSVGFQIEKDGTTPQISLIPDGEIPVRTFGELENRPTPLLYFEFYRKPARGEDMFRAKNSAFSVSGNPIHAYVGKPLGNSDAITPWFESAYSFRFKSVNAWIDVTKYFQLPVNRDDRIYFGDYYSPRGQLNVVDQEVPLRPLHSLAELQHLPLFDYRPVYDPATKTATTIWYGGDYGFHEGRVTQFTQNHAAGNSWASPGIPGENLVWAGWRYQFNVTANLLRMDRSYVANAQLWDAWFCSSAGAQDSAFLTTNGAPSRTARQVADDWLNGKKSLPNDAVRPAPGKASASLLGELFGSDGAPAKDAYEKVAAHLRIHGGFNVNSVSKEAWRHFLSGLLARPSLVMDSVTGVETPATIQPEKDRFLVSRYSLANAGPAERASGQAQEDRYWNGSRELTKDQIDQLAEAMVRQVKRRGPFLSMGEFVNRRVSRVTTATPADLVTSGALQSALDDPAVSINAPFRADQITGSETTSAGKPTFEYPAAAQGPLRQGITGYVTQADLLTDLGPAMTPRSDTFTIRTFGDVRDPQGSVIGRSWCEAVVQRVANYIHADADGIPESPPTGTDGNLAQDYDPPAPAAPALSPANQRFGRRFEIVSLRWLSPDEI